MTATVTGPAATSRERSPRLARPRPWRSPYVVLPVLFGIMVVISLIAATIGAAGIPLHRLAATIGLTPGDPAMLARDTLVLGSIRLPRIMVSIMVGAMLAASGTILQGLFRNPLADPALVGVSSGAALAAASTIVVGDRIMAQYGLLLPVPVLPITAFIGALITTSILYRIATSSGRTSIAVFLLGGLAIAALANAGTGLLVFAADDRQLRDISFWMLGSLAGATWIKAAALLPALVLMVVAAPFISRGLDLLVLGEAEAFHGGIAVERLKRICIVLVAAGTGAAVSISGVVGFVGIIVPHLLRLVIGPGHRLLLPASMLLGAALMVAADTIARMIVTPAELPIGIVTAIIGAPFFLSLLLRQRGLIGP